MLQTSPVVQCVGLRAPNEGGPGLLPGWGSRSHTYAATKRLHAATKHATTKEPVCRGEDPT